MDFDGNWNTNIPGEYAGTAESWYGHVISYSGCTMVLVSKLEIVSASSTIDKK